MVQKWHEVTKWPSHLNYGQLNLAWLHNLVQASTRITLLLPTDSFNQTPIIESSSRRDVREENIRKATIACDGNYKVVRTRWNTMSAQPTHSSKLLSFASSRK